MAITEQQKKTAEAKQHAAAHDARPQVRLVAGPGTGKSYAIQERVRWLLSQGMRPDSIFVVSFTRAAALDLRRRVHRYCSENGQPSVDGVSVSTLHSLALSTLRMARLLAYPADPLVMDDWELEHVFDKEFSRTSGYVPGCAGSGYTPDRCTKIRREYEAFCSTGQWAAPSYVPPDPPISDEERSAFKAFHGPRTQAYSCVLPGEIVRQCVNHMAAGLLEPARLLGIKHIVVDEFQDLNPSDLEFVDRLIASGVGTFAGGDDDQSLYSFRFASPSGIQAFTSKYPLATDHKLGDCFRCTVSVLGAATSLIGAHSGPGRIPKTVRSLYEASDPPEDGVVHRWWFRSGAQEARAIAKSCKSLIQNGVPPREILILISSRPSLLGILKQQFESEGVQFEPPPAAGFVDTPSGRFVLATLRLVCDPEDYVAHRLILGLRPQVGVGICNSIAELVIQNNLNYRDLFHQLLLPAGIFSGRQISALRQARAVLDQIKGWRSEDTISQRLAELRAIVQSVFDHNASAKLSETINHLPPDMTLEELRTYLGADTDERQASLLEAIYDRIGLELPEGGVLPPKVRMMTMHGAKGLSARVVFIPGLEESLLPGMWRHGYPGLVLEAARMLYVAITRARAACVVSHSRMRVVYGSPVNQVPSRFLPHLGGRFDQGHPGGLTDAQVTQVVESCNNLL
ncbi:MAG: ATP-dependent helicase [Anaerolineae bacterium]|nr:ATP-dependent helicase [Anaerolineae bacterium]